MTDTPGVHLDHRLVHILTPDEAKDLHPQGRLKPYVAPAPALQASVASTNSGSAASLDLAVAKRSFQTRVCCAMVRINYSA